MVNEFLKSLGIEKTCDDMFSIVVLMGDDDCYFDNKPDDMSEKQFDKLIKDIKSGKQEKLEWFSEIEGGHDTSSTYLYITAKDKQYKKTAELIRKFLYSVILYNKTQ